MFKRILVPLDRSVVAEKALGPALELAQSVQGEIILLHCAEPVPASATELGMEHIWLSGEAAFGEVRQESVAYLESVRKANIESGVTIRTEVVEGDPAGTIIDMARDMGVDLIAMSTHGYSGMTRWVMGSVTERVLRNAPCPVLVVHFAKPIKKILIPLDGSTLAEAALGPGLEIAGCLGSKVTLLRVVPLIQMSQARIEELEQQEKGLSSRLQEDANEKASTYLRQLGQRQVQAGQRVRTDVRVGHPAPCIVNYAEAEDIDLIVMATHGRTGLRRWVYGSVTDKVLHSSHCNLLVVRPQWEALN